MRPAGPTSTVASMARTAVFRCRAWSGWSVSAARGPRRWPSSPAPSWGAVLAMSPYAARALIADALDLRHRLPRLWVRVQAGQVKPWVARKTAEATRTLSVELAAVVDRRVAKWAHSLPWGRLASIIDAAIMEADPQAAADAVQQAEQSQGCGCASRTMPASRTSTSAPAHRPRSGLTRPSNASPTTSPCSVTPPATTCAEPPRSASSPNRNRPSTCSRRQPPPPKVRSRPRPIGSARRPTQRSAAACIRTNRCRSTLAWLSTHDHPPPCTST